MKICFISRGWPSEKRPQLGVFERDIAVALSKVGHQVFFVILDQAYKYHFIRMRITRERKEGVNVYNLCGLPQWAVLLMAYFPRRMFLLFFKRVIKEEGMPDIVFGHFLRYCARALAIKRKYGIPAVGMEHWSEMYKENIREDIKCLAVETYPYLDRVLVVSEALRENLLKSIGIDTTVVNNTYGEEFYYKEHVKQDNTVRFVLVGNLLPIKRFDLVIQALKELKEIAFLQEFEFTIIGDGTEKEKLQVMIDAYHLSNRVFLTGRKTRDYIVAALQEADVFILSSHKETFGVAPLEALACGVPVIATDCGGSRSYMNDFNGLLIPADDVKAMSEAISFMIDHYMEYDRKRIAEDCKRRFSQEVIAKQMERIFEDVIVKAKRSR